MKRSKRNITAIKIEKLKKRRYFRAIKRGRVSFDELTQSCIQLSKILRETSINIANFRIGNL